MTDECAEMIDNVQFVDDLEDETDIIDDIASDLLANVCCDWEKADQEYLGVSSSGDHQEASLTILEQMMTAEFLSLDQDESQESGVFDMANIYVPQDDYCEAGDMANFYVTVEEDDDGDDMSNIYVTQDDDDDSRDMNKEEIEAEFYELLQNMMHELSQVKTSPSLCLDAPVMTGYDEDRSIA